MVRKRLGQILIRLATLVYEKLVGTVCTILIARLVDVNIYGEIIFAYSLVGIPAASLDFGFSQRIIIDASKNFRTTLNLISTAHKSKRIVFIGLILLGITYSLFFSGAPSLQIIILIFTSELINNTLRIYLSVFNARGEYNFLLKTALWLRTPQLISVIAIYHLEASFLLILAVVVITNGMYWFAFYKNYNYLIKEFGQLDSKPISVGRAIINNKSLWTYQIFSSLYNRSEIFIVRTVLNFTQVGLYGVGYIFFRNVGIISLAVSSIYYPKFSQEYNSGSRKNIKRIILESTAVNIAVGILLMIIIYPLVTWFITHFYGDKYFAAIDIAEILLIGFPFILSSQNSGNFINVLSKTKTTIRVSALLLVFNLLLNIIFIGEYGLKATAIITVATEMIYSIILLIYSVYIISADKNNI